MRRIRPQEGLSNRDVATTTKGAPRHWCRGCDHDLVAQYGKCPSCGRASRKTKRNKTATMPARDLE